MSITPNTKVRMFGSLHTIRRNRGQEPTEVVYIPTDGRTGLDLANELDLPLDKVEAVFINNFVHSLDALIYPGDRVAFISTGVPGPHRYSLSTHSAFKRFAD
ncbi:MAG TPA: MoaD/ThiS family protein [Alphaproteobacteria bacterium]|nr:MoaD/ThiS family protein [Geobacteraceae bacterium]HPQ51190.1 MoaD/ThiS family protein [Alphaproteobacteria bacterium]